MLQSFFDAAWGSGPCGVWVTVFASILCAVGLGIAFFGYRLYSRAFGAFLCLFAFAVEAVIGTQWLQTGTRSLGKKLVISFCCVLWALLARAWAPKMKSFLEQLLDTFSGAITGFLVVVLLVDLVSSQVSSALGADYAGWDAFAVLTLGIPVALAVSWHSRGWSKILFVLATSILGALVAVNAASAISMCAHRQIPFGGAPAVLLVAALGALVQWFLD